MVQIKPANADRFIRAPKPGADGAGLRAILLYGPDQGLVRERANAATEAVLGEAKQDPFRSVELTTKQIADDPAILADEAAAQALTGGRRVVRVRDAADRMTKAFQGFLADPVGDALFVLEAGELSRQSSLVRLFEKTGDTAAVIPCYLDEARDIGRVIAEELAQDGLKASADALAYLTSHLGSDRQLTRREIDKLRLYMHGQTGAVSLADAMACVGDTAAITIDDMVYAVADGDVAAAERSLERAFAEGSAAVALLRSAARHFERLHFVAGTIAAGADADKAMAKLQPRVFWKQTARFKGQLRFWSPRSLGIALGRLIEAEIQCKRTGARDEAICGAALLRLAHDAARLRSRRSGASR